MSKDTATKPAAPRRRYTETIATRITRGALDAIDAQAAAAGLDRSTWVRAVVMVAAGVSPMGGALGRVDRSAAA